MKRETVAAEIRRYFDEIDGKVQGDGTTARLAGQYQDYLQKTMMDFRTGARGNNPGMSDLMKATSPEAITALAQYLAGMQIDQYLSGQGH